VYLVQGESLGRRVDLVDHVVHQFHQDVNVLTVEWSDERFVELLQRSMDDFVAVVFELPDQADLLVSFRIVAHNRCIGLAGVMNDRGGFLEQIKEAGVTGHDAEQGVSPSDLFDSTDSNDNDERGKGFYPPASMLQTPKVPKFTTKSNQATYAADQAQSWTNARVANC
jgi:hypothetical protein